MKFFILGLIFLLATVAGFFVVAQNQESNTEPMSSASQDGNSTNRPDETDQSSSQSQPEETGVQYIDYSPDNIKANSDKKIIVFFHADWCPNCRALEKTITAGAIPSNIVILKADYDKEVELKKKYGVTQQTTMVQIDNNGNKLNSWVATAFDDIEAIKEMLS